MSGTSRWRRLVPRGLFSRTLLIFATPVALMQVGIVQVFFDVHWERAARAQSAAIAAEIAFLAELARDTPEPDFQQLAGRMLRLKIANARIVPEAVRGVSRINGFEDRVALAAIRESLQTRFDFISDRSAKTVTIRVPLAGDTGTGPASASKIRALELHIPRARLSPSRSYQFLVAVGIFTVLASGAAVLFIRNQIRPIEQLARAAAALGQNLPAPDFHPWGAREVRRAGQAILDMHARIRAQIAQRTLLLAGVSHDLRTPLTRMKLHLALAPPGPDRDALAADVEFMRRTLESYIDFARDAHTEAVQRGDLSALLRRLVDQQGRAERNITCNAPPALMTLLRPNSMERALRNILENAAHHATEIRIDLAEGVDAIHILIDDNGPGIPEERREEAFSPFVRLDSGRNLNEAESPGSGLGLAIARDIVRAHGGEISLETSPAGGLRVRIWLPAQGEI